MSEANHTPGFTPGPWKVVMRNRGRGESPGVADAHDGDIATTYSREARDANARLIAAAPDLYAVCMVALEVFEIALGMALERGLESEVSILQHRVQMARAAVAKAK